MCCVYELVGYRGDPGQVEEQPVNDEAEPVVEEAPTAEVDDSCC